MKKALVILIAFTAIIFLQSCAKKATENKKDVLYVTRTDTTIVIYRQGASTPIVLPSSVSYETLVSNNIPTDVIDKSIENKGMYRYVDGEKNDIYAYGINYYRLKIMIVITLLIVLVVGLFSD